MTQDDLPQNPLADLRLRRPPFWMIALFLVFVVLSWIPLVVGARRRVSTTEAPQIHIFQDMDNQPKFKAQHPHPLFADGRADRAPIPGTVARGQLEDDDHYYRGFSRKQTAGKWEITYFKGFPSQVKPNEQFLTRGRTQYNIYCSACHGLDGYGNGPVHLRALELQEPRWVQPASLHNDTVRQRTEGHLYNTIANGIRNMAGYGGQIVNPADRWAIVAYVRALQLSQDASADFVPPEKRTEMK
jgi:mono/diheme cytochrome c family protein